MSKIVGSYKKGSCRKAQGEITDFKKLLYADVVYCDYS